MPTSVFFEEYPLYKKLDISSLPFDEPAIRAYCKDCQSFHTFNRKKGEEYPWSAIARIAGLPKSTGVPRNLEKNQINPDYHIQKVSYICAACQNYFIVYFLKFNFDFKNVEKIGQFPSWSIDITKPLERLLVDFAQLFKKGLECESISFGIGAYAYYRRIIELVIDNLLESLKDVVPEEEKLKYMDALVLAQNGQNASDKITLIKDLLPPILRPNNTNPLSLLHEILSQGIHSMNDEDCLEYAKSIRTILVFLVEQTENHKNNQKQFTEGMKKLLDKKSKNAV